MKHSLFLFPELDETDTWAASTAYFVNFGRQTDKARPYLARILLMVRSRKERLFRSLGATQEWHSLAPEWQTRLTDELHSNPTRQ